MAKNDKTTKQTKRGKSKKSAATNAGRTDPRSAVAVVLGAALVALATAALRLRR